MYDITNPESFENIQQWMNEIEMYTTFPDVVTLLVGNKLDKRQKDGASV